MSGHCRVVAAVTVFYSPCSVVFIQNIIEKMKYILDI